ncbi:MAG: class A sortase [Tetragenococcus halophilus]|uniref:Class A sortase n=1 Tax=Tetragenococcus halophilus subsp. halophilus TaxID=1513897 RepID=A0A2H6CW70_TETHA|nr:class A sortase [Tetragenococcus halophilus]MDN6497489.1 class A sortase [Tetragenococcus koreensis]MCO7026735.1 class A sortase [Tetragenococcus halophilus]MDN6142933.1 class A sortase [Tetragenococcus halophilus]MDN6153138.1 class A sortase [Tetragenococcus halophilus]MDN6606685.1 class A sortase [Tetragenococcus halophilus]
MKKWLFRFLLLVVLVVGVILIFNKQISYYLMQETSEGYQVANTTPEEVEENEQREETFELDQVEPVRSETVVKSQLSEQKEDLPVVAGITVPSVGIDLPIFKGLANENLLYGAGTLTPDQKMGEGNYALASHRMNNPELLFTPLERVSIGDNIYLTDLENVYTYQTTDKQTVDYTDTSALQEDPEKAKVTLITCEEMDSPKRIVVQGKLVDTQPIEETTVFDAGENK